MTWHPAYLAHNISKHKAWHAMLLSMNTEFQSRLRNLELTCWWACTLMSPLMRFFRRKRLVVLVFTVQSQVMCSLITMDRLPLHRWLFTWNTEDTVPWNWRWRGSLPHPPTRRHCRLVGGHPGNDNTQLLPRNGRAYSWLLRFLYLSFLSVISVNSKCQFIQKYQSTQ